MKNVDSRFRGNDSRTGYSPEFTSDYVTSVNNMYKPNFIFCQVFVQIIHKFLAFVLKSEKYMTYALEFFFLIILIKYPDKNFPGFSIYTVT